MAGTVTRAVGSLLVTFIGVNAASAFAQLPAVPGLGGAGLPNVSGMGMSNAAGVLSYCTKNKLLGGSSGASSVLSTLQKKPGVTSSKDFAAGQAGQILGGKGGGVSLASISDPLKGQACGMVLKQARRFL